MRSHRSLNSGSSKVARGPRLFPGYIAYCSVLAIGILGFLGSAYSLYLGKRFDNNVANRASMPHHDYKPQVCVVMTCKGLENRLERNIEAILSQKYEPFHTIIVTDSTYDPAFSVAKSILTRSTGAAVQVCTSAEHPRASGKVSALLTALETDSWVSEVYAFVDSDALVPAGWLAALVNPLREGSIGATTGFRWYFPSRSGLWSHVQAAWNAAGTNLLFDDRYNFPWGGAMAVRMETLRRINLKEVWETAVSDDLSLNSALRKHGYAIKFLPQCCVATYNETNFPLFVEWATRQVTLTKAYHPKLWKYGLAVYSFFNLVTLLGLVSIAVGAFISSAWFLPAGILLIPSLFGVYRGEQRAETFKGVMPEFAEQFQKIRIIDAVASLIVPWIMTYCIIKSARTNEIEWRGRKYHLTK